MTRRAGISFVDVMIILGIVLLLAALAVPRFINVPDYGNEEDDVPTRAAETNATSAATNDATEALDAVSTSAPPPAVQSGLQP